MRCCPVCFGDSYLKDRISVLSKEKGTCPICGAINQPLVAPIALRNFFELLLDIYQPDSDGDTITDFIRKDWLLFDSLNNKRAGKLLSAILDDSSLTDKKFLPIQHSDHDALLSRWTNFRKELMHNNRFFPNPLVVPDLKRLQELLGYLTVDIDTKQSFFRARIQEDDNPILPRNMGQPSEKLVTNGRANPAGIPYLYLASDIATAISEIRPHTGEKVCIAEFGLKKTVPFADLRNPRKTISPFSLPDETDLVLLRRDLDFLCKLGDELTHPVVPKIAHLEYLPSQYLCEYIKHCGFAGVIYRSSVSTGTNYALFDATHAVLPIVVKLYDVKSVTVDFVEVK